MRQQVRETGAESPDALRLDKWLWAARFFKTRGLAQEAIDTGRVLVAGERVKTARMLRVGELLTIKIGELEQQVLVRGLSSLRGPAPVARDLYLETEDSVKRRQERASLRRLATEPAWSIEEGRPTKRDRRQLDRLRGRA
ncbi:MAG: RNA-binding S4 domain-containing protein [Betaproteobacteria bacterium]